MPTLKTLIVMIVTAAFLAGLSLVSFSNNHERVIPNNSRVGVTPPTVQVLVEPPPSTAQYNFTYTEGNRPWEHHLDTTVNTTFQEILQKSDLYSHWQCKGDASDANIIPFPEGSPATGPCFEGNGAKMIILANELGKPNENGSRWIFPSPERGGLFGPPQNQRSNLLSFFPGLSRYPEQPHIDLPWVFFVIPFNGYEVPTFSLVEATRYLPIWKEAFKRLNGMNETYFNSHVFVVSASIAKENHFIENATEPTLVDWFSVTYYVNVDWAQTRLTDRFRYYPNDSRVSQQLIQEIVETSVPNRRYNEIQKIVPIPSVATKLAVENPVRIASTALKFDVNNINNDRRNGTGELVAELFGTVDMNANKCIRGTIQLKDAAVHFRETSCVIF